MNSVTCRNCGSDLFTVWYDKERDELMIECECGTPHFWSFIKEDK